MGLRSVDDLTTSTGLPEAQVEMLHLLDDELHVLLPPDHRLAGKPYIALQDLAAERWALDTTSATYSNVIVDACQDAGFDPIINGHCHSFEVVRAMVEAGCSVSINPGLRGRDYIGTLLLKEIRPAIRRQISVAFRNGERRNPAVAGFVAEPQAVAASMSTPIRPTPPSGQKVA